MDQGLLCDLEGIIGSVEVPPAAGYVRPHQEGSVVSTCVVPAMLHITKKKP